VRLTHRGTGLSVLHHRRDSLDGVRAADLEPGLAQQAEAFTVRMAVCCNSPPERGRAVLDDCTPSLSSANMLDEQEHPSPENIVTEVTKALEQIS
jgi:hypothetical protein